MRGFGLDEFNQLMVPVKYSNVMLSRIEHTRDTGGCPFCFPHGMETTNSKFTKDLRCWKRYRTHQRRER